MLNAFTDSTLQDVTVTFDSEHYNMLHYPVWETVKSPEDWKCDVQTHIDTIQMALNALNQLVDLNCQHIDMHEHSELTLMHNPHAQDPTQCITFYFSFVCKKEIQAPEMHKIVHAAQKLQALLATGDANVDSRVATISS